MHLATELGRELGINAATHLNGVTDRLPLGIEAHQGRGIGGAHHHQLAGAQGLLEHRLSRGGPGQQRQNDAAEQGGPTGRKSPPAAASCGDSLGNGARHNHGRQGRIRSTLWKAGGGGQQRLQRTIAKTGLAV